MKTASDSSTRERLLQSGKKEFLEKGYEKASLRRICAAAGVTTGAFYFQFAGKEDLFAALVQEAWMESRHILNEGLYSGTDGKAMDADLMDYFWKHREAARLLLSCAEGTSYDGLRDQLRRVLEAKIRQAWRETAAPPPEELIGILAEMQLTGYLQAFSRSDSKAQMKEAAEIIHRYAHGGIAALTAP